MVDCGGLESRFPATAGTGVQIPPSPRNIFFLHIISFRGSPPACPYRSVGIGIQVGQVTPERQHEYFESRFVSTKEHRYEKERENSVNFAKVI